MPDVAKPDAAKTYILLVEDEDSVRLTLRDFLQKKGYSILVASDGVSAIKQLLDHEISMIITDYRMQVLGGDYWIKFLDRYCSDKKIIITSGFLRPEFPIPFDVIYKPYDYDIISEFIKKHLDK